MKKALSIILLFITIFISSNIATALEAPYYTNLFKEGMYKVNEDGQNIKPGSYKFSLITPNSVSYVYVIDKNNIQRYSKRFCTTGVKEGDANNYSKTAVITVVEGDIIVICGEGEMYLDLLRNKSDKK